MPIQLTPVVKMFLITCFIAFVVQQTGDHYLGTDLMGVFALTPASFYYGHRFWQLITYPFFHHNVMHLFFNLMMFAFIGSDIESRWGSRRLIRYFFFCALSSGLAYLLIQWIAGSGLRGQGAMNGATGAIYGLLVAYGILFAERVLLFMMLFPLKAKHYVWVLALLELLMTLYSGVGRWESLGHLAGMLAGFSYLWFGAVFKVLGRQWFPRGFSSYQFPWVKWIRQAKKVRRNHRLKLVINNERDFDSDDSGQNNHPKTWH